MERHSVEKATKTGLRVEMERGTTATAPLVEARATRSPPNETLKTVEDSRRSGETTVRSSYVVLCQ